MKKNQKQDKTSDLRSKVEKVLKPVSQSIEFLADEEVRKLAHELQVHQIELEMQNEDLRISQQVLEESRVKYSSLYDFAPVGYVTLSGKGFILKVNVTCAKMLGKEPSLLIKKPMLLYIASENQDDFYRYCNRILNKDEHEVCELKMVKSDGSEFYAQLEGVAEQSRYENEKEIRVAIADITVRRLAEEELQKSNALLSSVIESPENIIIFTLDMSYNYLNFNTAHAREMKKIYDADIEIGQHIFSYIPREDDRFKAEENYKRVLMGERFTKIEEYGQLNNRFWYELAFNPIYDNSHHVVGFTIFVTDITERKKADEKLKELNSELQEQDKMRLDFLSTVSHEIRTPLTLVLGFVQMIDKKLENVIFPLINTDAGTVDNAVRQIKENICTVRREGVRLTGLLTDTLDISKMEAGKADWKREPFSVTMVIERALEATNSFIKMYRLEIVEDIEDELPEVAGDIDKIVQVVINLISNAIKFTEEGPIICKAIKINKEIVVSVIDKGIGIADTEQEKVFEKFSQVGSELKGKPIGTGLGLAICKDIVEHYGGRIWVESELGKGSNISFSIPCSPE
jgi:PAS domain S-box-containing protein